MELADVVNDLYGLVPGDFIAERNDRVTKLKGDEPELAAQVKALAKPSTAAWLVNQLVRHHGDEVEQVAQVGAALREAQEGLERDELMQLNKQRQVVLRAVTQQARALARDLGHPVSGAIAEEVEQTLRAVMSDPAAADAVRTGTLLRSLSGTGFGEVDLTGALALPEAAPDRARPPAPQQRAGSVPARSMTKAAGRAGRTGDATKDELAERRRQHERDEKERARAEKALAEARQEAEEADREAARADGALDAAQRSVDELEDRHQALADQLHALEQQVRDAQSRLTAVQRETRTAERQRDAARHESEVAHRAADRARQRVDRLS